MARVASDDDSIDRFIVCRYIPGASGHGLADMEYVDAFDSYDQAFALFHALNAEATRLTEGPQGESSPYRYTIAGVEAGTLRRERNLVAIREARQRGEDFGKSIFLGSSWQAPDA